MLASHVPKNISGPDSKKIKKKMCKIFKQNGLIITVECNLAITDFLNVTFVLKSATYYPCKKLNNKILYIRKHMNHPPSIIKQIPSMITNKYQTYLVTVIILIKLHLITILLSKKWFQ